LDRRKWPATAKGLPALRRAHRAAGGRPRDQRQSRRGRGLRAPVRPADRGDPVWSAGSGHDETQALDGLGLEPGRYILFVGRLEPENNPHMLVDAFSRIDRARAAGMKLVIVGGAP